MTKTTVRDVSVTVQLSAFASHAGGLDRGAEMSTWHKAHVSLSPTGPSPRSLSRSVLLGCT